ncbi:MAG: hypothetical protein HY290_26170 [Planctomycetia bacterium]|nr:hypothetical protein [Planctomycetia bacterium]
MAVTDQNPMPHTPSAREKKLLDNALESLNRLFDRNISVIDVWALMLATAEALRNTPHAPELERAVRELLVVVSANRPFRDQRDRALEVTDDLRHYLASKLPLE